MLCFVIVVLVLIASWSLYLVDRRCREIHADSSLANNEQRYTAMEGYVCFGSVFFVLFVGAIILSFFVLKVYAAPFVIDFLALIPAYKRKNALLQRLRSESFPCDKCGNLMEQKSEEEDNAFLDPRSDMEDSLMSVDADVFVCGKCGNVAIYKYESRSCKYSRCPQCQVKAYFKESSRITVQPAVQREGIQEDIYRCLYCNYSRKVEKRLPAEPDTSAASLVAGAIIGSALGGGNRGGGSFGGGSFGGGRSGGGGATSGW
jgi:uncharacterized protein